MAASPEVNPYTGRVRRVTWLRRAVAVVLLGVAGAVAGLYFIHRRQAPAAVTAPLLGLHVQQSASGVTIARDENGRPVFRVHAARVDKLRAGGNVGGSVGDEVLHDVRIEVFDRQGQASDSITGKEFSYNESTFELQARGQVEMTLAGASPVQVTARDLRYNVRSGLGAIAQGLTFAYLNAAGQADVAELDGHAGRLQLRGVALTWKRPGESDLDLRGGAATVERQGKGSDAAVIRLSQGASVRTGAQSLTADALVFHFRSDQTLRQLEADGQVAAQDAARALQARAGRAVADFVPAGVHHTALQHLQLLQGAQLMQNLPGRPSTLAAQTMDFQFGGAHQLQTLLASGGAHLEVGGPRRQSVAAAALAFDFTTASTAQPRLAAMRSLGRATMHLASASNGGVPVEASADAVQLMLDDKQQLRRGLATGQVELAQVAKGEVRQSQSDRLELVFAPGPAASTLEQAVESGHVVLRQGESLVRGDRLVYHPADGSAEITADAHSNFTQGYVRGEDALTRFQARHVTWTQSRGGGGQLAARGDVSLSREATPGTALPSGGLDTRLPVVVTARALDWTQPPTAAAGHGAGMGSAVFRGGVRLLQSPNLLTADQLQLDQAAGTLLAQGHVRTTFLAPLSSASAPNPVMRTARVGTAVQIEADSLHYGQAAGEAIFRGQVGLQSGNARLTAPELQVWITQNGRGGSGRLERALAQGGVSLTQPGRTATAQQLHYDFASGRIELVGGPPSIFDAEHGQIHGDPLTFFLANDEIQVGSPRGARAEGQTVVH